MLGTYLSIVRRRLLLIAAVGVLVGVGAYLALTSGEAVYRSEAVMRVGARTAADAVLGRDGGYEEPDRRVANELEVMESPDVFEQATALLGPGAPSVDDLQDRLTFEQRGFSDAISVIAEGDDPEAVQDLVDAVVAAYIEHRQAYQRANLVPLEADLAAQAEVVQAEIAALDAERATLPFEAPAAVAVDAARSSAALRYEGLVDTLGEVRLALAGDLTGIEVVSGASLPEESEATGGLQVVVLAAVAGLLVAGALAVGVELVRNPVRTRAEAERVAAVPVLATLPLPARGGRRSLVGAVDKAAPEVSGAARGLRLGLEALVGTGRFPRTAMVAGTSSDADQVRFVALALAASCGRSGLQTLLVADVDEPHELLARGRGHRRVPTAVADGQPGGETVLPGVSWLPATAGPGQVEGPLLASSLDAALRSLREVYDVVIVVPTLSGDAAEVVAVGKAVEAVVAVCALGRTAAGDFEHLVRVLARSGAGATGVALAQLGSRGPEQWRVTPPDGPARRRASTERVAG